MSTELIDPRLEAIKNKFSKIRQTIMIASGKGGVGKSLLASTISLILSLEEAYATGLLDLDLHGPVTPVIFDIEDHVPEESKEGLKPPIVYGVKVMSLGLLAKKKPIPMSGSGKRDAIREVLAITNWGELDYLVIDLPPGTGDEILETANLIRNNRGVILVTTPSLLSIDVVSKTIELFDELDVPIIGIVENMAYMEVNGNIIQPYGPPRARKLAEELGIRYLAMLPLDPEVDVALSKRDPQLLLKTKYAKGVREDIIPHVKELLIRR